MNNEVKGMVMPLNKETLNELLAETKEIVASDIIKDEKKLSVADLWNVQRQYKPRVIRKWLN